MIPEWLYGLGGLVLCVLLVPYVLGPILVYFTLRFRMPPTVVAVDPRVHPLPAEARNYLSEAYRELTSGGFDLVGTMFLPNLVPNIKTLFAIYANRTASDMAMSAIVGSGRFERRIENELRRVRPPLRRRGCGPDKQLDRIGLFKTHAGESTTKFWQIRDIRRLYHLHQRLSDRFRQRGQPTFRIDAEFRGDAVQYIAIKAVLEETFRDQVGTGYLSEGPSGSADYQRRLDHGLAGTVAGEGPSSPAGKAACRAVAGRVGIGFAGRAVSDPINVATDSLNRLSHFTVQTSWTGVAWVK